MSQLSGIVSLIFIVAAFVTSCDPQPTQGSMPISGLQFHH